MKRDAALAAVGLGGVLLLAASARGRSRGGSAPGGTVRIDPEGVIRETRGGVTTVYDRESLPEAFTETEVFGPQKPDTSRARKAVDAMERALESDRKNLRINEDGNPEWEQDGVTVVHDGQHTAVYDPPLTPKERAEIDRAVAEEHARLKAEALGLPPVLEKQPGPVPKFDTQGLPPSSGGPADLDAARREVRNVARHIYNAGGGYKRYLANRRAWAERAKGTYSRKIVRDWQEKAGLEPDGLYGPNTRQRMIDLGAPTPPPPLFVLRR